MKPCLIVILGPTAIGKTATALYLAQKLNTEIISADARQVYKELQIGVAKPSAEELAAAPHHFIGHLSIRETYSAGSFERDALACLDRIFTSKNCAIMAGGSGLYIKAVTDGLDAFPEVAPEVRGELKKKVEREGLSPLLRELREKDPSAYQTVDRSNPQRIIRALEVCRTSGKPYSSFKSGKKRERPFDTLFIGLTMERQQLYQRINKRVNQMIADGLIEEARSLHPHRGLASLETVGYTELFEYFEGKTGREEAIRLIKRNSRRYAKRQLTWMRSIKDIHYFEADAREAILAWVRQKTAC